METFFLHKGEFMKKFILPSLLLIGGYVLAQAPSPTPASAAAVATPSSGLNASFVLLVSGLVLSLNTVLSTVQVVFTQWSKAEPGWLTTLSGYVAKVAAFIGSNPSL
jgi:hypothetical protein